MDGKGTFRDIIIATAYALVPFVLINLPLTFVSNYLTMEEGTFYHFFRIAAVLWSWLPGLDRHGCHPRLRNGEELLDLPI
jgi:hypothetical protein